MPSPAAAKPNRLIDETSPYLLQHAYNPVDWYPWGPEALERARLEKKLILLSVGYSACHWCHVMERESFEDEKTAAIMNQHYVCIKVDREERPDLDKIYQLAHQLFNQRAGGWPLTAFLTYDEHAPVYIGTYFPDKPRHGMPSFAQVLENISKQFNTAKRSLGDHNQLVKNAFSQFSIPHSAVPKAFDQSLLTAAVDDLLKSYDPVYGGFGAAPKFPHPTHLAILQTFCQRMQADTQKQDAAMSALLHTLDAMGSGGLYDQIGGGFCRYSVDARWEIPHFEKMLYDNAQLIPYYADFGIAAKRERFLALALASAHWVIREMQSPAGGYYSTLDADSEGEEGKFYVWSLEDLQTILSDDEYKVFDIRFGLRGTPNFEGKWHLTVVNSMTVVAQRSGIPLVRTQELIASACKKLFVKREQRVRPGRDDKILAAWNGLMIKAMAIAGRRLKRTEFVDSAQRALDFVRTHMWSDSRLLATAMGEQSRLQAYLDDYVFIADAVLEMLQTRWRNEDFAFLTELVETLFAHFADPNTKAFYFTGDDHEKLIHRSLPTHDDATPSGNGVAAQVLLKLGYLTGESRYLDQASELAQNIAQIAQSMPSAFGSVMVAVEQIVNPSPIVIVRGNTSQMKAWADAVASIEPVNVMIFQIPPDVQDGLPQLLAEKVCGESTIAYVCTGLTCSAPCHTLDDLLNRIRDRATC